MTEPAVLEKEKMTTQSVILATGRRKKSTARVRLLPGEAEKITVNNQPLENYLPRLADQMLVRQPLKLVKAAEGYQVVANVSGGGHTGQAGAIRLGIARTLVILDPDSRKLLHQGGFLTRDPRAKERKKYGRHGARRGIQYSKR